MADNTTLSTGAGGDTIATDDIGGVKFPRSKIVIGADGSNDGDVSSSNPMPVIIPVGAGGISKAEDAAHSTGDVGVMALSVRKDTAAATSGTDGDYQPLITDSNGRLHVIVGGTVTVNGHDVSNAGTFAVQAEQSGPWNIGTLDSIVNPVTVGSISSSVDVVVGAGSNNIAKNEDTASANTDVGAAILAVRKATPANTSGSDGDYEFVQMSAGRVWVSAAIDTALPAGSNAIGKLAANDGVDIDDVTINNANLSVNLTPKTSGGLSFYKNINLLATDQAVKGSAGQVYWIFAMNLSAAPVFLKFYNATTGTVTVGSTVPDLTIPIPTHGDTNGAGVQINIPMGLAFSTAITIAATTGIADNNSTAPNSNEVVVAIGYA